MAHRNCTNLLRSDDFALIEGSSLALEQVEGVFINLPHLELQAKDDLRFDLSRELRDDVVSNVAALGKVYSGEWVEERTPGREGGNLGG